MTSNKPINNLLDFLNRTRPFVVRGWAIQRHKARPVIRTAVAELVRRSGIPHRSFIRLSYLDSWEEVPIGVASRFAEACGVKIWTKNPLFDLQRRFGRYKLSYLKKSQRRAMDKRVKGLK